MSNNIKVAVLGHEGRMGAEAAAAVERAEGLELVATIGEFDDIQGIVDAGAQVMIDFTVPQATRENVRFAVDHNIHAVVGTTGWDDEALEVVRQQLVQHPGTGVLIAPNFAVGAVLAMKFSEMAAAFFESAEVIELHHPDKLDAPSGTAARTANLIAEGRERAGLKAQPDATEIDPDGARGADIRGVHVHSVRLRGLVAHQETLLGNPGEQLTIRHDSFHRESFMTGVVLGVRKVVDRPGLTHGLEGFMDLGL